MRARLKTNLIGLPRFAKRLIVALLDCCLALISVWFAYYLRLGEFLPFFGTSNEYNLVLPWLIANLIYFPTFLVCGLYHVVFRYQSIQAFISIGGAFFVYGSGFFVIFTVIGVDGVPKTIGLIQPLVFFLCVLVARYSAKFWLDNMYREARSGNIQTRVLIYGAGNSGRQLCSALSSSPDNKVIGFLDDNEKLHGSVINGVRVFPPKNIKYLSKSKNISEVMLALPGIGRFRRNEILLSLSGNNLVVRTLPSFSDLTSGRVVVSDILELSLDDILGRDSIAPNNELMSRDISGKVILVTGAGGSIGSELCREILRQRPKRLILVDHSEFAIYAISQELRNILSNEHISCEIVERLASVSSDVSMTQLFALESPDTIYHAAAYKHVPLVESNQVEGLKNNLFGTIVLAKLAMQFGVRKFVLISTDKAVRPTNIMGASKRLSEMALQAFSTQNSGTIFSIVRFGNVLGSSGSVVPLFREQIKSGGPITLTHRDVTRYFMSISEAAQLVIQAGAMTEKYPKQNQAAPVYLLDMGEPIKIFTLAKSMINLSGLTLYNSVSGTGDIDIKITGLRPGEKLFEELLIGDDVRGTFHPKIKVANESFVSWRLFDSKMKKLKVALNKPDNVIIDRILGDLVDSLKK